jgi:class 3 adenylate cyclase
VKKRADDQFSPALRHELTELIASAFSPSGIDELGRLVFRQYSSHAVAGEDKHITISRHRGAQLLVEQSEEKGRIGDLIKLVADLDGSQFQGKRLDIEGIEVFFNGLARAGMAYDPVYRRFYHTREEIRELKNWASLRDGRSYEVSVISADIVGNSRLVRANGAKKMEQFYFELWRFLGRKIGEYDGRMWTWAGDGGLLAFTFKDHVNRCVKCAIDIQISLPLFNISPENPLSEPVALRLGVDSGPMRFYSDTGRIVSDVINYATHLEKTGTQPGCVSLSERVVAAADSKILTIFEDAGPFEGSPYRTTGRRLDLLFGAPDGCGDAEESA